MITSKTIYDEEARTITMLGCFIFTFVCIFMTGLMLNISVPASVVFVVLAILSNMIGFTLAIIKALKKDAQ